MLQSEPDIMKWKIDFTVLTSSIYGGTALGQSSIVVGINQLPVNGTCIVNPTIGKAAGTYFVINCTNWVDPDGVIARYEYFGKVFENFI